VALAEAVIGRTALVIYAADRHAKAGVLGHFEVQPRTYQHIVATDLRLAKLNAAGDERAIAVADDEADPVSIGMDGSGQERVPCKDRQGKDGSHQTNQKVVLVSVSHFSFLPHHR
jgi:hypothetical protein